MDVITDRPSSRLRRLGGAGLGLGVLAAALVGLPSAATAAAAPAFGTTWVTSQTGDSVTELSASGSVLGTIQGASTGLSEPQSVAVDAAGQVFVTNKTADSITEYADGANGNVAPIATISGSKTGLSEPVGIAVAGSDVWVADSDVNGTLERFSVGSNGNVLPFQSIYGSKTKLDNPQGIFLTDDGLTLWVVSNSSGPDDSVTRFDTQESGNQAPDVTISGSKTQLSDPTAVVADNETGRVSVANSQSGSITEYEPGSGNLAPAAVISGAATKLDAPSGLGLDAIGRLSVANNGDGELRVFAAGAHGNIAPIRSTPGFAGAGGDTVFAAAPSLPRSIKATAHNHSLSLSWAAPASSGGGVTRYDVAVLAKKPTGLSAFVPHLTGATHYTAKHLVNGHTYYVGIAAENHISSSAFTKFIPASPASVPGAPRTVKLTAHHDALTVTWKAPKHDGGRAVSRYVVKYATCTIGTKHCHAPSITVKGTTHALKLTGLSGGTAYHVEVTAKNSQGSGKPSKPVTGVPTG
ncbi:MAG TPA: fibronectin type III domain-containing protein [Mycobacteriales bacterium]|jgi:hypothetical protein|nr:fibronectin type III domain-containing protein [Mycobacteriales bacterium]